ncbi:hypothetical protein E2562_025974 [Oryza meyeriana var. granulata]|uniref:Uncharacterized protein n=1 Tax=Oryza meyeriana var. granulata TaxID=110450 RepID=A0A6G1EZ57_9ORYZ|nr:hypothetical protein E2562_025974 [Oryza meyeriana var. granulata]
MAGPASRRWLSENNPVVVLRVRAYKGRRWKSKQGHRVAALRGKKERELREPLAAVAAARTVRQLYWKLRSRFRPKRHAGAARFGYDLESYSRNFDDGLVSSRLPLQCLSYNC